MSVVDRFVERQARQIASRASRRGFLGSMGRLLFLSAALPVLPSRRASAANGPQPAAPAKGPADCDYWRHCSIDGDLCGCCGGSSTVCPPGSKPSTVAWVGTCHNPSDGRDYMVNYHDCCGGVMCGQCYCNNNVGDRPGYRMGLFNDLNWCIANEQQSYVCTLAVVIGEATPRP